MSTALELQRQCPGVLVTILADEVSPCTTGDGAAGLFSLFLLGDTPLDKQVQTHMRHKTRLWSRQADIMIFFGLNQQVGKNACIYSTYIYT